MNNHEGTETEIMDVTEESYPLVPGTEMPPTEVQLTPQQKVALLEEEAKLAPRRAAALRTILLTYTYAGDWVIHGTQSKDTSKQTVCLKSAGAERLFALAGMRFSDVVRRKQTFTDQVGEGYRYVYEGWVHYRGVSLPVRGTYSTRDKFLGYVKEEGWRPVEDINEGHIANAAYHIFVGNGVKAVLGLRNLPYNDWKCLIERTGQNGSQAGRVAYGTGTKGGTSDKDREKQREIAEFCMDLAKGGMIVIHDHETAELGIVPFEGDENTSAEDLARLSCEALSEFQDPKTKEWISRKSPGNLRSKWLNTVLGKVRKLRKQQEEEQSDEGE